MPSALSRKPHVLILGAGLGGLALAQGLRKQGISFEIFEKDKGLHSRFQGWAIALHFVNKELAETVPDDLPPLEVVNHLQPLDLKPEMAVYRAGENGQRLELGMGQGNTQFLRANRSRLRDWLTTNLSVNWDKHATHIAETNDSVTIDFSDGSSATGDILVGADGVHSFARKHLLGEENRLRALPIGFVIGELTLDKAQYERQLELAHSAYVVVDMKHAVRMFTGLNSVAKDASSAKYYWQIGWDDPAAANEPYWTATASKKDLHEHALKLAEKIDLDPKFTEQIRLTKVEDIVSPPLVIRDMVLKELPNQRVTLLGDAAHPMTPFRGEGGNNALMDSIKLSQAIGRSDFSTILKNVKEYQCEMLERGSKAVEASRAASEDLSGASTQAAVESWRTFVEDSKEN